MQKQPAFWLALCCRPEVLVLDEPVDGLDPVMSRQVWSLLLEDMAEEGTTVLVSSHNLRELEDVCDHVGILSKGRVLLERSLSELQENVIKIQIAFHPEQRGTLPLVALIFGILVATAAWSYLYNNRAVSMIHSLPLSRGTIFLTNYLAGISFFLIPNAVIFLLSIAVEAGNGALDMQSLGLWFLALTLMCFFFYFLCDADCLCDRAYFGLAGALFYL